MCIEKRDRMIRPRYFSEVNSPRLVQSLPCGYCEECQENARREWRVRAYYEAKRCLDKMYKDDAGNWCKASTGYLYFDCLTYSEYNIPRIQDHLPSDFKTMIKPLVPRNSMNMPIFEGLDCKDMRHYSFSRDDLLKFFKNLRRDLDYAGYDVKNKLKYFVGCEYGEDPTKTMRSHYHILLYVNFKIDPGTLSKMIADCWHFGRTDGYPWRSLSYVYEHNVIDRQNGDYIAASNYVSKYVTKPYHVSRDIRGCVRRLFDRYFHNVPDWLSYPIYRKRYLKVLRESLPFHVQSHGFGEYCLYDQADNVKRMEVSVVNSDGIKLVSCPSYIRKKFFYDVKTFNGRKIWLHNQNYVDYMNKYGDKLVSDESDRMRALVQSGVNLGLVNSYDWQNIDYFSLARYKLVERGVYGSVDHPLPVIVDHKTLKGLGFPIVYSCRLKGNDYRSDSLYFTTCYDDYSKVIPDGFLFGQLFFDDDKEKLLYFLNVIDTYIRCQRVRQRQEAKVARERAEYQGRRTRARKI